MSDIAPLRVGDIIHGFASGVFGRDHYDCCRVEAIGADWVIARTCRGTAVTATGRDIHGYLVEARFSDDHAYGGDCPYGGDA